MLRNYNVMVGILMRNEVIPSLNEVGEFFEDCMLYE